MKDLNQLVNYLLQLAPTRRWWVAYSGGMDSHVLLHALKKNMVETSAIQLCAIHINHQLSPHADAWESHCLSTCKDLAIPLTVKKVDAKPLTGESPEAAARLARYQAIANILPREDCLLTAHHCDDQAETLLLQLFRGAGLKGISSMPNLACIGQGYLVRPFLGISRDELTKYAVSHSLKWVDDESNDASQFDRNYLRNEVFPLLKARWPKISSALSRTAELCSQSEAMLSLSIRHELEFLQGSVINTISQSKIKQTKEPYRSALLREWISCLGHRMPSRVKLNEIIRCVIESRYDANPLVSWDNVAVRRYGDDIYLLNPEEIQRSQSLSLEREPIEWDLQQDLVLPGDRGVLRRKLVYGDGINAQLTQTRPLTVCFRKGGERLKASENHCSHSLKKLFQAWRVPPWLRGHIPLILYQEKIIQVVGYSGLPKEFSVGRNEQGYVISLEK